MKINIQESLKERDAITENRYNLYNTYTANNYTAEQKKNIAEAIYKGATDTELLEMLDDSEVEYREVQEYAKANSNRRFRDEDGNIFSIWDLLNDFIDWELDDKVEEEPNKSVKQLFIDYIRNSTDKNGTLEEIKENSVNEDILTTIDIDTEIDGDIVDQLNAFRKEYIFGNNPSRARNGIYTILYGAPNETHLILNLAYSFYGNSSTKNITKYVIEYVKQGVRDWTAISYSRYINSNGVKQELRTSEPYKVTTRDIVDKITYSQGLPVRKNSLKESINESKSINEAHYGGAYDIEDETKFRLIEKRILTEGTKYDKKAITKLVNSGLFDEETSTNIINALFREDIHAFVHAPAWLEKYLIGIVNMLIKYCNGDATKAQRFLTDYIGTFEEYLTYVKDVRPKLSSNEQLELDKKFNEQMSIQDLEKELEDIKSQLDKESKEKLKNMKFEDSSNFELIPIDSYRQFNRMFGGRATGDGSSDKYAGGGGTAWCHANSESTYDSWIKNGSRKFFVIANKNWKNISFNDESNKRNPKDTYGNSLIAILVNKSTGKLLNATLRCNHVGVPNNADNQYKTYAELSSVAGFNVEDKVMEYLKDSLVDMSKVKNVFDGTAQSLDKYCELAGISREDLTEFIIPDGITSIGDSAFAYCKNLTKITIPDSVTSIGDRAFNDCESLTSITIPDSVTSIGKSAFHYCARLTKITIPYSVTSISNNTFESCNSLTSVAIPDSVTSIGRFAFTYCESLTSIVIPDNVTSIGDRAFAYCERLAKITIPYGVTKIGDYAFAYCESLTSIIIPDNVTKIGDHTFAGCESLTEIIIPDNVTSISYRAFSQCTGLTKIVIPDNVTKIGDYAFDDCDKLTIACSKDSYAEKYAEENSIPVILKESINDKMKSKLVENINNSAYVYRNLDRNNNISNKHITEAHYGGAFDIEDDQYFTKEDLMEFAEDVVDSLNVLGYSKAELESIFLENNVIEITVSWDGNEVTVEQPVDMRRIHKPKDLDKYRFPVISKMKSELKELGFDFGPHFGDLVYELEEDCYKDINENCSKKKKKPIKEDVDRDYAFYLNLIDIDVEDMLKEYHETGNKSPSEILIERGYTDTDSEIMYREVKDGNHTYRLVIDFEPVWEDNTIHYYVLKDGKIPARYTYTKTFMDKEEIEEDNENINSGAVDINQFTFTNYLNPDGQSHPKCKTYKSTLEYMASETERLFNNALHAYSGEMEPYKQLTISYMGLNRHSCIRDLVGSRAEQGLKDAQSAIFKRQHELLELSKQFNKWNGKEWVKSSTSEEFVNESKSLKESSYDEANDDDLDDIQTYFYDDEVWKDNEGVEPDYTIEEDDIQFFDEETGNIQVYSDIMKYEPNRRIAVRIIDDTAESIQEYKMISLDDDLITLDWIRTLEESY